MDNWAIAYLSLEYTIMLSLLVFILVIFGAGSIFNNVKRDDKKKKQTYVSRREKLKKYNRDERRNK